MYSFIQYSPRYKLYIMNAMAANGGFTLYISHKHTNHEFLFLFLILIVRYEERRS